MEYIEHKDYHIFKDVNGNRTRTLYIDKDTNLVAKVCNRLLVSDFLDSIKIVTLQYDSKMPIRLFVGEKNIWSEFSHSTQTITLNKLGWENNKLSYYEDNNGNWYDKNVLDMPCPFELDIGQIESILGELDILIRKTVDDPKSDRSKLVKSMVAHQMLISRIKR